MSFAGACGAQKAGICAAVLAAALASAGYARAGNGPFAQPLDRVQLIVTFRQGTDEAAVADTMAGATVQQVGAVAHTNTRVVSVPALAAAQALDRLGRDRRVVSARRDPVAQVALAPNDPQYQAQSWTWTVPGFPAAWDRTVGSGSVTVAVVDTGVDPNHEDLIGSVLPGYDFVNSDGDPADDEGHGTLVAGVVAGHGNNGIGMAGGCWACKILPVKVLDATGHGSYSAIANGIYYAADHGAQVINLSLGGTGADPILGDAVQYAVDHGALVVMAAGNASSSNPFYPAYYASSIDGALSVAASDQNDDLYAFSNYGNWVEVAASGCAVSTAAGGGYGFACGTSLAAPQVAAEAALALSLGSLTPAQLEATIRAHVDPLNSGTIGGGRIDADTLTAAFVPNLPPAVTANPVITGPASVGFTLAASGWAFNGTAPISVVGYAWERCDAAGNACQPLAGQTATDYAIVAGDLGATLRFAVTAVNAYGQATATSAPTPVVTPKGAPANTALPTISGRAEVRQELSVADGSWSGTAPIATEWQWQRCRGGSCQPISGATGRTYVTSYADLGATIAVVVTAANAVGTGSATSSQTAVVIDTISTSPPPPSTPAPPGAQPDLRLAADGGWRADGTALYTASISLANAGSATGVVLVVGLPQGADLVAASADGGVACTDGHPILCTIGALAAGQTVGVRLAARLESWVVDTQATFLLRQDGSDLHPADNEASASLPARRATTAAAVSVRKPLAVTPPRVTGAARRGRVLTATVGSWRGAGISFRFAWYRCAPSGGCTGIGTGRTHAVGRTDVGARLRVDVTAVNATGSTTRSSKPTAIVAAAP